ncbi:MAG: hypothetical protein K6F92_09865 [Lachnospiraceae bacterium]|nr:hypothetical protein [Lachnospiraceae bacterium]
MFFSSKSKKARRLIESKIFEANSYLDNNYRDNAKGAYREMKELLEEYTSNGDLKPGDITALSQEIEHVNTRIQHMGHY